MSEQSLKFCIYLWVSIFFKTRKMNGIAGFLRGTAFDILMEYSLRLLRAQGAGYTSFSVSLQQMLINAPLPE